MAARTLLLMGLCLWPAVTASAASPSRRVRVHHATGGPQIRWLGLSGNRERVLSCETGSLEPGDGLVVFGELDVTNDVATRDAQPGSISYKGENRYPIRVTAGVRLMGAGDPIARAESAVSPRNHHGLVTLMGAHRVEPSEAGEARVELLAAAETPRHRAPHDCLGRDTDVSAPPHGKCLVYVEPAHTKQQLDVLVLADGWQDQWKTRSLTESRVVARSLGPDQTKLAIVLPLGAVKEGEVFTAVAKLRIKTNRRAPMLVQGELIIGETRDDARGERVSARHGFNLPGGAKGTLTKVAAFTARRDYQKAWLKLKIHSNSGNFLPGQIDIESDSGIEVTRYSDVTHVSAERALDSGLPDPAREEP